MKTQLPHGTLLALAGWALMTAGMILGLARSAGFRTGKDRVSA